MREKDFRLLIDSWDKQKVSRQDAKSAKGAEKRNELHFALLCALASLSEFFPGPSSLETTRVKR